jgi:hypothetical protein
MSALIRTELEARASAVDSALALACVRIARQTAMVRVGFYLCQGRYHFMKLVSALDSCSHELRVYEVDEIAAALDATARRLAPGLRVESAGRPRLFERLVRSHAVRLFNDLHELVARLHKQSAALKMKGPGPDAELLQRVRAANPTTLQ